MGLSKERGLYFQEKWEEMEYRFANIEMKKEIERLNKRIEDLNIINEEHQTLNKMIRKELQQKENIIKEVREYIEEHTTYERYGYIDELQLVDLDFSIKDLKQILDKENI